MSRLWTRLEFALQRYGWPLCVAVVVLGLAVVGGGVVGMEEPRTTTVTDHTHVQTVSTNVSSAATVTAENPLYDTGVTLTDQSAYLASAAPNLTVVVESGVEPGSTLRYRHEVALRYTIERGDEVVWSATRTVASEQGTAREGRARTEVTVATPAVADRLRELRSAAGGDSSVAVAVVVTTDYETDRYDGTLSHESALSVGDTWYSLSAGETEQTHSDRNSRRVTVPAENRDAWLLVGGGLVVSLAGVAGVVATRRFAFADPAVLAYRLHQERYEEWISRGRLPSSFDRPVVTVESLGALGELAVDRGRRIVFDESLSTYVVVDDGVVYRFSPEGR
ncbi:DUF5305 family protein [Haloarchaeobius amylolyticus]|uniref:DUF5305 family protein n=1 Tax=Haloarchaeobius amylolyticus TaxID=1198296 RepID=UPI00227058EF|nr:DUF5305 family protein [Haloarchaeobius amylolyticus]